MTSDKAFFERLGRQIKYDEQTRCGEELSTFKTPVFKGVFQWLLDTLTLFCIRMFRLRSVARAKAQQEGRFLDIILEYGPRIQGQFKLYEQAFRDWESRNRRRCDYGDSIDRERTACAEYRRLTLEAQGKLVQTGYPFAALTSNLTTGMEGWTSVDNAMVYWDTLSAFFSSRVVFLTNLEKENWKVYRKVTVEKTNHRTVYRPALANMVCGILGTLVLFGTVELYRWIRVDERAVEGIACIAGVHGLFVLCRLPFSQKKLTRIGFWAATTGIIIGVSTLVAIINQLSTYEPWFDHMMASLPMFFQLLVGLISMVFMLGGLAVGVCCMGGLVVCIMMSFFVPDDEISLP